MDLLITIAIFEIMAIAIWVFSAPTKERKR